VALFLALYRWLAPGGFQRTAVNRHPALWSPDLPPVHDLAAWTSDCLACFTGVIVPDAGDAGCIARRETRRCSGVMWVGMVAGGDDRRSPHPADDMMQINCGG